MALFWPSIKKEQEYIASLFSEHRKLFYSIAKGYAENPMDAEDIIQTSIESLIRASSRFMEIPEEKQLAYIAAVIRHDCVDFKRKKNRHPECSNYNSVIDSAADEHQDFVRRIEAREQIDLILSGLKEDDRVILELKYVLEATTEEIAEILGCQKQSVFMRLSRAKNRAHEILMKKGDYADEHKTTGSL